MACHLFNAPGERRRKPPLSETLTPKQKIQRPYYRFTPNDLIELLTTYDNFQCPKFGTHSKAEAMALEYSISPRKIRKILQKAFSLRYIREL